MTAAAAALALLLSVGLLCCRRTGTAAQVCAAQSLCAAVAIGQPVASALAFALNGLALPWLLSRFPLLPDMAVPRHATRWWSLVVVTLAAAVVAAHDTAVAVGLCVTLLGLSLIALREHRLVPALGLLSAQNGLVLVAAAGPAAAWPTALVVAVPLVPALVLADAWLRR